MIDKALDPDFTIGVHIKESLYGSRSVSECEQHGMICGCPGCPVLARGDCDNEDAQQYKNEEDK